MGLYLIASTTTTLDWLWVIFQVAFGLGLVIFVHELGHFLVAKACGVKCEKFFIGFDIGGYKVSRQWGETEYGIGILPLGGYVKMLGQDDNPANAAREMERAKIAKEQADGEVAEQSDEGGEEEEFVLDPRSYQAKSVPQRMAIISAGVVMNVIFAFIFATIAYSMGVKYTPCVVGGVVPGSPAWKANLQVGDEIVRIGDVVKPRFRDMQYGVSLGDLEAGVPLVIERPGDKERFTITIKPDQTKGLPKIGVASAHTLQLLPHDPVWKDSPAAHATPKLEGGDTIVAVDGKPVATYRELTRVMAENADRPLKLTVRRDGKRRKGDAQTPSQKSETLDVQIPARPLRRLGLVMTFGPITAVQEGSPAADAGLRPGDFIQQIDGQSISNYDPMSLPEQLARKALAEQPVDREISINVRRSSAQGRDDELDFKKIRLRIPTSLEPRTSSDMPVSIPALGICYRVLSDVRAVVPESPAATAKDPVLPGDKIVAGKFVVPDGDESPEAIILRKLKFEFSKDESNWPTFIDSIQDAVSGTKVALTVKNGEKERTIELMPDDSSEWFVARRGLKLDGLRSIRKAESFGEAVQLGLGETKESLLLVYRFLQKLVVRQIPVTALGGPVTIAKAAGYSAFDGLPSLLIFLTVLSANLAVVNFLPIPVLDGGHMVFLIIEGVFRRPVSERVVVALHVVGLAFIVSLMAFVLALDLGIISRGL